MRTALMALPLLALAIVQQGCTIARTFMSVRSDRIEEATGQCVSRQELRRVVGGADETLDLPGSGYVDIHTVLIRGPESAGPAKAVVLTLVSLGIKDLVAAMVDAVNAIDGQQGCEPQDLGAACEFRKERWHLHYARDYDQVLCSDVVVLRRGPPYGTEPLTTCPYGYKKALSAALSGESFVDLASDGKPVRARSDPAPQLDAAIVAMREAVIRRCGP